MAATFCRKTDRNRRALTGAAALLIALYSAIHFIQPVAAQAAPSTQPTALIQRWVQQLADPENAVREKARDNLMGLQSADLPTLHKVLADASSNLLPSQKVYLRDIVKQVYLAGLEYEPAEQMLAFIGVSSPDRFESNFFGGNDTPPADPPVGITFATRIPGFSAYRMLRDGDVIISIEEVPDVRFTTFQQFTTTIGRFHAGDVITLELLRNGERLHVPIKLLAKPAETMNALSPMPWLERREAAADVYWQKYFQPIVKDDGQMVSTAD